MSKVWGGLLFTPQRRVIVKARNQKDATAALDAAGGGRLSLYEFRGYWCRTGNAAELAAMQGKPDGTVLVKTGEMYCDGDFIPVADFRGKT